MKKWLLERGSEASTWRGLTLLASAFGIVISPEMADSVVAVGMAISGFIGVVSRGQ